MLLEELTIENMFCYRGQVTFDLRGSTSDRNLLVIWGRNGHGKTSFLRCLKLLFAGVTNELRASVVLGRTLGPHQFVVGSGERWSGIFNRPAREAGELTCGITATWLQDDGQQVQLRRYWQFMRDSEEYQSLVQITKTTGSHPTTYDGEQAEDFLRRILHAEFIRFFFFDGEEVQRLAEGSIDQEEIHLAVDILLGMDRIRYLIDDGLAKLAAEWRRAALDEQTLTELNRLDNELRTEQQKQALELVRLRQLDQELPRLREERQELRRRLEEARATRTVERREDLEQQLKKEQDELEKQQVAVCQTISTRGLLLFNQRLATRIRTLLDEAERQALQTSQHQLLEMLRADLPRWLFDYPPHCSPRLDAAQSDFYRQKLLRQLEVLSTSSSAPMLETTLRQRLRMQLGEDQPANRAPAAEEFRRLAAAQDRVLMLRDRLEHLEDRTVEERDRAERWQQQHEQLSQEIGKQEAARQQLSAGIEPAREKIATLKRLIDEKEQHAHWQEELRRQYELVDRLTSKVKLLLEQIRHKRRQLLEEQLTRNSERLFRSHSLLRRIQLDEEFGLQFRDHAGATVGSASLSAGTKQLVAIAWLWALKEASGQQLPVAVDTPIARLDLGHRRDLLEGYFPHAAEQVVILPTDAELRPEEFELLRSHIYRSYCLHNPTGQATQVTEQDYPVGPPGPRG